MKPVRIGIFGLQRGASYIDSILENNGEIVAVCDKNPKHLDKALQRLGNTAAGYSDFDSFIEHPMDAVFLANYFHEHAPFAIRALEKNIHVLSECTPNGTMAEGVALVEAAQKSGAFYMLAENYPFMLFNQEMKRIYEGGTLGRIMFGEGEYNHPVDPYAPSTLSDGLKHWRNYLPATYYVTHSLAPLVLATGSLPVRVTAFPITITPPNDAPRVKQTSDRTAIITMQNHDSSVFRVTGCASFGLHENSYRLCCTKGQIENVRGTDGKVMLSYNSWEKPEGAENVSFYKPELQDKDAEFIKKAGHGGGDFFVVRKFFESIRENKEPEMDVYFATRLSSVGILAHRSLLAGGAPFDIPDFRLESDRNKFRNDRATPFWGSDGSAPNIPAGSDPSYGPSALQIEKYLQSLKDSDVTIMN